MMSNSKGITDSDRINFLAKLVEDGEEVFTLEATDLEEEESLEDGDEGKISLFTFETQWIDGNNIRSLIDIAIKSYSKESNQDAK